MHFLDIEMFKDIMKLEWLINLIAAWCLILFILSIFLIAAGKYGGVSKVYYWLFIFLILDVFLYVFNLRNNK